MAEVDLPEDGSFPSNFTRRLSVLSILSEVNRRLSIFSAESEDVPLINYSDPINSRPREPLPASSLPEVNPEVTIQTQRWIFSNISQENIDPGSSSSDSEDEINER